MMTKLLIVNLFLSIALLSACGSAPSPAVAFSPVPGPLVPIGQPEVIDLGPTSEPVWNCGEGGGTVIKHPAMSVVTSHAVEWEIGGTTGVGLTIGEGVIPGGINLNTSLEGHYTSQFDQNIQQGMAWDLPAEKNTVVVYTLMWRETWQRGYIDTRLRNQSLVRINVSYRTGIQSDIVGKRSESCPSNESVASVEQPIAPTQQPGAPVPVQVGAVNTSVDCSTMIEVTPHHTPSLGVLWNLEVIGDDRVLTIWSNHRDPNLPEYKFFLPAGQSASFMSAGGVEYRAKPGCSGIARVIFERDPRKEITVEQFQAYINQGIIP